MKSEEIASEDFRNFDEIPNEYGRDELKKESDIQNEIARLTGPGPNLNDQIGHTHAKSKDGEYLKDRCDGRVIELDRPGKEVQKMEGNG
jgi:hypothetical protein